MKIHDADDNVVELMRPDTPLFGCRSIFVALVQSKKVRALRGGRRTGRAFKPVQHRPERAGKRIHEHGAEQVDHGQSASVRERVHHISPSRRTFRVIEGADDAPVSVQPGKNLPVTPHMIARSHKIHACGKQFIQRVRRHAHASGNVLPVGNDHIERQLLKKFRKILLDGESPRLAHHVAEKKNAHQPSAPRPFRHCSSKA